MFIACDIDHTLLSHRGDLLPANVAALAAARAQGATVVLATARSYAGARPIHAALGLDTPLVVNNGTLVCDPDGRALHAETLSAETARALVAWFQETPHHWAFRTLERAYLHPDFDTSRPPWSDARHYRPTPLGRLGDSLGDFDTLITASLFGVPLRAFFEQQDWRARQLVADYYPPSHYSSLEAVSVMAAQASKARAVAWLRAYLGQDGVPTLAVGDSVADAGMFALGVGVAPADASPEALNAAHWIAPPCDEGAVAAAVGRFVLGR